MNEGEGEAWASLSGGRSKLCASGAIVATCGLVFGPEWPGDEAARPSVMRGRLYFCGEIIPGDG